MTDIKGVPGTFTSQTLVPGAEVKSREEIYREKFGSVEIPNESVPLPSRGLLYPKNHPLYGVTHIDIKSMTSKEEKILTNRAYAKDGSLIVRLLESCMVSPKVDPNLMLECDRNAVMLAVRIVSYGADYVVEMKCGDEDCTNHKSPYTHTFDLSVVPVKNYNEQDVVELGGSVLDDGLFSIVLPVSKKTVAIRFETMGEAEAITKQLNEENERRKKIKLPLREYTATDAMVNRVVALDGNTSRAFISEFFEGSSARDNKAIRAFLAKVQPAVIMKQDTKCPACSREEEVVIPLTGEFFWPTH